jgi:hypothetical protein
VAVVLLVSALHAGPARAAPHEFTAVPVVGGDSDVGFGGGYMLSYARTPRGYKPFKWRVESAGVVTFKPADQGNQLDPVGVQVPLLDDYLLLQFPHVRRNTFEVELRLSYTREGVLKFYGLGNSSPLQPGLEPTDSFYKHQRTHPMLRWLSTLHATKALQIIWGLSYTHNWLNVPEDTLLAQTMENGSDYERRVLGSMKEHGVAWFSTGVGLDTRDHEIKTQSGINLTARADFAPGGIPELPYQWGRLTASASAFLPLVRDRVTLAGRVVTDLLFGDPPFYELPRYDNTYFGGGKGIRGVPAQRYWGKIKLFSNAELRTQLFSFHFWSKTNWLGLTAFFDSGRLWADYQRHPELDGTGVGLKYGTGGGLRLTAGDSFVLRADVAYSPDAHPISAYLTSGQMF